MCFQNEAHHLLHQLVTPVRNTERALSSLFLGDEDASDRCPDIPFLADEGNDVLDFLQTHAVYRLSRHTWGHGSVIVGDAPVGIQVEARVIEQAIGVFQWLAL